MWEPWERENRSSKLPSCSIETTRLYSEFLPSLVAFGPQEDSDRRIAQAVGGAPSTISREISFNGGQTSYRAGYADAAAWKRAHRPKCRELLSDPELASIVASKLKLQLSPEQIAGRLKHTFSGSKDYQVSHETIYRSLFIQARALKKELLEHRWRTGVMR
jgi:IS30 family transposase